MTYQPLHKALDMLTYFKNIVVLPWYFVILIFNLRVQKKYIKKTIAIDILDSKTIKDGSLNDNDFKKISNYYALAVPAILGESFCVLRNKKMTRKERYVITYLGGLSGLLDDFFDSKNSSEEYIKSLIINPLENNGKNSFENLIIKLYNKALSNSTNSGLIQNSAIEVFQAQKTSKTQTSTTITKEEIEAITYHKGGVSFQFYRNALENQMTSEESLLVYKLGALLQLENDIFDVYKDLKDGIKTMLTTETKIENIRKKYSFLYNELKTVAYQTNYPSKNIQHFLQLVSLVICRGYVCLDMLEKNEKRTEGVFRPEFYSRKELICDMEKPLNFIKSVNYFAKINNSYFDD